ncbi:3-deoxy-D-manno-octulosonic acid transferase [Nitrospira defluvii]|uniref:3-deoxy-D-manno-octulosonic acid transferase n=1 Tax=Nitrospira defluvii TaxID=330214 RepID=A0ABN7MKH2_9BACT|nr:3-deoxy-D-manno-octulosonic acid transferase [Nitrospira defluvii]CAE6802542.1 3-deoxy-D-manno-octulosonic acid transferase [Nitrospira defluvii]
MWYLLYNSLLLLVSPIILCVLLAKQRCRRGLPQRLGLRAITRHLDANGFSTCIWIHAVSLGEVVAVAPLVRELRRRYPDARLVVSTVTETGREAVEQRLEGVAEHRYAPLDFPWVVNQAIEELRPNLYVFVETELWPNLLRSLWQRQIPSVLVNGRLSTRSFERQRLPVIRGFYRTMLNMITRCLMQSERDAQRMIDLGADAARVNCTGNIKFDQPVPQAAAGGRVVSKEALGFTERVQLVVAGSTHPGEEEAIVTAYQSLCETFPDLRLVLAPRHIERAAQVEQMVVAKGLAVSRRSVGSSGAMTGTGPRVVVLDTRGELALLYREAVVAFVGGTLVPVGGHNLLEPAVWGKPVLFGPHTDHCAEVAALLLNAQGGRIVPDAAGLAQGLRELLSDPATVNRMGQAARQVVADNQGALQRSADIIAALLPARGPSTEGQRRQRSERSLGHSERR